MRRETEGFPRQLRDGPVGWPKEAQPHSVGASGAIPDVPADFAVYHSDYEAAMNSGNRVSRFFNSIGVPNGTTFLAQSKTAACCIEAHSGAPGDVDLEATSIFRFSRQQFTDPNGILSEGDRQRGTRITRSRITSGVYTVIAG